MSKYLDNNGLLYLWNSKIKPLYEKALPKSGGTMTGPLMLHGEPSSDLEAASKRSEEHTSELQSRPHLVCRLLLEQKKKKKKLTD